MSLKIICDGCRREVGEGSPLWSLTDEVVDNSPHAGHFCSIACLETWSHARASKPGSGPSKGAEPS